MPSNTSKSFNRIKVSSEDVPDAPKPEFPASGLFTSDDLPNVDAEKAAAEKADAEAEKAQFDPFGMALEPHGLDAPFASAPQSDAPADQAEAPAEPIPALVRQVPQTVDSQGVNDRVSHENKLKRTRRILSEQRQVTVRLPKSAGPQSVIINGARFNIPANLAVEVPEDVAKLLYDAEII